MSDLEVYTRDLVNPRNVWYHRTIVERDPKTHALQPIADPNQRIKRPLAKEEIVSLRFSATVNEAGSLQTESGGKPRIENSSPTGF